MSPELRAEFKAAVVALAREYGASQSDAIAAAKLVPRPSPKRRVGHPREKDAAVALDVALAVVMTDKSVSRAADEAAQKMTGQKDQHRYETTNETATQARLSKKAKAELARAGWKLVRGGKRGKPENPADAPKDVENRIRDRRAQGAIRIRPFPKGEV